MGLIRLMRHTDIDRLNSRTENITKKIFFQWIAPGMVRPDCRVLVVSCDLIHLDVLMKLRLGIFNVPFAVIDRIHI